MYSQEQPESCIIIWSGRKGKSCEGGWEAIRREREGWSGWKANPWKGAAWVVKKQWVLGPTCLTQPRK